MKKQRHYLPFSECRIINLPLCNQNLCNNHIVVLLKGTNSSNKRLCYFITIALVLIIIIITFSLNGISRSRTTELELEPDDYPNWGNVPLQLRSLKKDFRRRLFNLSFSYITKPKPCSTPNLLAIIIVTSHYHNVETRSAMRRAFSSKDLEELGLRRLFLLGEAPESAYKQEAIVDENNRFGDLIQGNFREAYRNLTYKHMMGLKWVSENCYSAQYLVKMDDDIVVNIEKFAHFLNSTLLPKNLMAGYVLRNMLPIREPANKWYVTKEEYPYQKYPSFVSGWLYVTTPKIAGKFFLLSNYFEYFWIDDVYVTGILTKNLKIRLFDLKKYFTVFPEFLQCCINDVKKRIDCPVLVGPNGGNNNLFYEFNEAMKICGLSRCDKRSKPINETCVAERKISLRKGNAIIENYNLH